MLCSCRGFTKTTLAAAAVVEVISCSCCCCCCCCCCSCCCCCLLRLLAEMALLSSSFFYFRMYVMTDLLTSPHSTNRYYMSRCVCFCGVTYAQPTSTSTSIKAYVRNSSPTHPQERNNSSLQVIHQATPMSTTITTTSPRMSNYLQRK